MTSSGSELAYDCALQSVTAQRARLDNLRARAATLLAATSLVTGFLGAEALKDAVIDASGQQVADRSIQGFEVVAVASFVVVALTCLWMLRPQRRRWRFEFSANILVRDYVDQQIPIGEMHRHLALVLETNYDANEIHLGRLMWWQQVAAIALVVEILAWLADLSMS